MTHTHPGPGAADPAGTRPGMLWQLQLAQRRAQLVLDLRQPLTALADLPTSLQNSNR